jgi:hypothetical protein
MDEEKVRKRLEGLEVPGVSGEASRRELRRALVGARRSSRIGIVLVAVPCLFLFGIVLRYGFGLVLPGFAAFEEWLARVDRMPVWRFVSPLVLAGGPIAALALNLLSLMHVQWDGAAKELRIAVRMRLFNLLIVAVCLVILGALLAHALAELTHHGLQQGRARLQAPASSAIVPPLARPARVRP